MGRQAAGDTGVTRSDGALVARNTAGLAWSEFCVGLALPVITADAAFLPLLMRAAGGTTFEVGLMAAIFWAALAFLPLVSAYLTRGASDKRTIAIVANATLALPPLAFGGVLLFFGPRFLSVAALIITYAVLAAAFGLSMPLWREYVTRLFPPARVFAGLSVMFVLQTVARILGGLLAAALVDRFVFAPAMVGSVFIGTGVLFALAALTLALTRELAPATPAAAAAPAATAAPAAAATATPAPATPAAPGNGEAGARFVDVVAAALRNRSFLLYMANDIEFYGSSAVTAFYAVYATEHVGVAIAAATAFVVATHIGSTAAFLFLGRSRLLSLRQRLILGKCLSVAGVLLVVAAPAPWAFFAASALLGIGRATRQLAFLPVVKLLSRRSDATAYYAVAQLVTMPLSVGLPLLAGQALHLLAFLGGDAYRLVFGALAALMALSMLVLLRIDLSGQPATGQA